MDKLQYLLRAHPRIGVGSFANQVLGRVGPALLAAKPSGLTLTLTTASPPRIHVTPFRRRPVALVSLWIAEGDDAGEWTSRVIDAGGAGASVEGWRVEESIPVDSMRTWPPGTRTPGAGMLTLLRRRAGLSDEEFFRRWFQGHTPLSLEMHPLWRYVRNVTGAPLVDGSTPFEGIVEEHFRDRADLLKLTRFFGGPWEEVRSRTKSLVRTLPNMVRTGVDVSGFLDMRSLEVYLIDEFRLRCPES